MYAVPARLRRVSFGSAFALAGVKTESDAVVSIRLFRVISGPHTIPLATAATSESGGGGAKVG